MTSKTTTVELVISGNASGARRAVDEASAALDGMGQRGATASRGLMDSLGRIEHHLVSLVGSTATLGAALQASSAQGGAALGGVVDAADASARGLSGVSSAAVRAKAEMQGAAAHGAAGMGSVAQAAEQAEAALRRAAESARRMTTTERLGAARDVLGVRSAHEIARDLAQVEAAYKRLSDSGRLSAAELVVADQARQAAAARLMREMRGTAPSVAGVTAEVGKQAQVMRQLAPQITDTVTSLASGMPVWMVAIQQGGQMKDVAGGLVPLLRALGGAMLSPAGAAVTLAAGVGVAGAALLAGQRSHEQYRDAMALTGGYAGVTEGALRQMGDRVATAGDVTIGTARDITQALVASGKVGPQALEPMAVAVARVADVSGRTAEDVAQDFAGMSAGVYAWAKKQNESWHFATSAQLEHIRALEEAGEKQQAMAAVSVALTQHHAGQAQQLGHLERLWRGVGKAISEATDRAKDWGRTTTPEEAAQQAQAELARIREASGPQAAFGRWTGLADSATQAAQGKLNTANRDALRATEAAAMRAHLADQVQEERRLEEANRRLTDGLTKANPQYIKDLADIQTLKEKGIITEARRLELLQAAAEKYGPSFDAQAAASQTAAAQSALSLAQARSASEQRLRVMEAEMAALDSQRTRDLVGLTEYADAKLALEDRMLAERLALNGREQAAVRARPASTAAESATAQAELVRLQADAARLRDTALASGKKLLDETYAQGAQAYERAAQAFRQAGAQAQRSVLQAEDENTRDAIAALSDPVQRAMAEAALAVARSRQQTQAELTALRQALAAFRAAGGDVLAPGAVAAAQSDMDRMEAAQQERERLIGQGLQQQLKPQWQQTLDGWRDTTRVMRETWDTTINDMVSGAADAFGRFVSGQQVSLRSLAQQALYSVGRGGFQSLVGSISQTLSGGGVRDGAGASAGLQDKALVGGSQALSDAAASFSNPAAALATAGQGLLQSAMGWLVPQAAQTASATGLGAAAVALQGSAGALVSAAGALSTVGAAGSSGGLLSMIPAFETGGLHAGGLRLVGERGPELEVTGPSRIFSASQTQQILGGGHARGGGAGLTLNMPMAVTIDARSDAAQVAQLVAASHQQAQKHLWQQLKAMGVV